MNNPIKVSMPEQTTEWEQLKWICCGALMVFISGQLAFASSETLQNIYGHLLPFSPSLNFIAFILLASFTFFLINVGTQIMIYGVKMKVI